MIALAFWQDDEDAYLPRIDMMNPCLPRRRLRFPESSGRSSRSSRVVASDGVSKPSEALAVDPEREYRRLIYPDG